MATVNQPSKAVHHGRNVRRFREMLNLKQEALASLLGDNWSQKKVSVIEGKEVLDSQIVQEVARALNVSPEAISNFTEEMAINIISNSFADSSTLNINPTFYPVDKLVEMVDENKKLYEALLESERDKVEILKRLLDQQKG